jgi:hypothetical protein
VNEDEQSLEWTEWRSFDDLPDVVHSFVFCADLAEILLPCPQS